MEGKRKIAFFSNNKWCPFEKLEEFADKSSDYAILYTPEELSDDEIDFLVRNTVDSFEDILLSIYKNDITP